VCICSVHTGTVHEKMRNKRNSVALRRENEIKKTNFISARRLFHGLLKPDNSKISEYAPGLGGYGRPLWRGPPGRTGGPAAAEGWWPGSGRPAPAPPAQAGNSPAAARTPPSADQGRQADVACCQHLWLQRKKSHLMRMT
jgi:hypothetical protein